MLKDKLDFIEAELYSTEEIKTFLRRVHTLLETIGSVAGMYDIELKGPVNPGEEHQQECAVEFDLIMQELKEI